MERGEPSTRFLPGPGEVHAVAEPPNLGALRLELFDYHDRGDYERDVALVTEAAWAHVQSVSPRVARPAVVLDVDEVALTNWPYLREWQLAVFQDPFWVLARENAAPALRPVLAFYRRCLDLGVGIHFITGRQEHWREITEGNLRAAGYERWAGLWLKPDVHPGRSEAFKQESRRRIEAAGEVIVANLGDQWTDLTGGHNGRPFKIPNPFYLVP